MIIDHFPTLHALWRRAGGLPRRIAAAVLACVGLILVVVPQHERTSGGQRTVVVAARAVRAGVVVRAADVRVARWPARDVAESAIRDPPAVIGRSLTSPAGAGELLTTTHLLGTAVTARLQRGQSAVAVTLRGAAQLAMVSSGSRIDLYAAGGPDTGTVGVPAAGGAGAGSGSRPASGGGAADDGGAADGRVTDGEVADGAPLASDVEVLSVLGGSPLSAGGLGAGDQLGTGPPSIIIGCDRATAAKIAESGAEFVAALRP